LLWDHIALNTQRPFFADARVRNAFKLSFDYKALAEPTGEGWLYSGPLHAMFPEAMPTADAAKLPGYNADTKEEDRAEAQRLMTAAGYEAGAGIAFAFNQSGATGATFDRAIRMQEQLRQLFPQMQIEISPSTDFATYNNLLVSGEYDARSYVHLGVPDVALEANTYFHSTGSRNYQGYEQPWIDETMEQLKVAQTLEERTELVRSFETRYLEEGPAIWITHIARALAAYQGNTGGQDLVGVSGTWANGHSGYGIQNRWFWQTE
jgi:peptide/nickel transport system substrate-binding protein